MKKAVAIVVMLVFALSIVGFVGTASAAMRKAPKSMKITGEVVSVDTTANIVILKAQKGEMTFTVDKETRIMAGRQQMTLADLKAGTKLTVKYSVVDGKNVAKRLVMSTAPAPISE